MPEESKVMNAVLENLKLALTSPRERAPITITSYLQTAKVFLAFLGEHVPPGEKDFRRYFLYGRKEGKSERTLAREYVQLAKLASANNWPFTCDKPIVKEEPLAPAFTPEEVEILIRTKDKYSRGERFYLAVSTTWGLRREEMVRLRKRDYTETSIRIKTAKRGRQVEHLIPEEIKPILFDYQPRIVNASSLTGVFYRVLSKAGLEKRKGYGWHSARRTLRALLELKLAQEGLPPSLVANFMGMSTTQKSIIYGSAPTGIYPYPELASDDPFAIDRLVLEVHPFLKLW